MYRGESMPVLLRSNKVTCSLVAALQVRSQHTKWKARGMGALPGIWKGVCGESLCPWESSVLDHS